MWSREGAFFPQKGCEHGSLSSKLGEVIRQEGVKTGKKLCVVCVGVCLRCGVCVHACVGSGMCGLCVHAHVWYAMHVHGVCMCVVCGVCVWFVVSVCMHGMCVCVHAYVCGGLGSVCYLGRCI